MNLRVVAELVDGSVNAPELLRLAQFASAPYDRFVWEDAAEATRVAEYLLSHHTGEIAPPAGQLSIADGRIVGMLACMTGAELARRRLSAAYTLAKANPAVASPESARRARLASRTFASVARDEYYLARLTVAPEARGQGHGQWLIERLFELAQGAGARNCWLEVDPDNTPAVKLYERAGFRVVAEARVDDDRTGRSLRFAHMRAAVSDAGRPGSEPAR